MTDQSSGGDPASAPPPGWQPPPGASPQTYGSQPYPTQPYPGPPYSGPPYSGPPYAGPQYSAPPPGFRAAAHKPGAMPLRPLGLGDIFDAAFRIIRFNPRATVGSAVLVAAVAMAIPVVVTAILSATLDLSLTSVTSLDSGDGLDRSNVIGLLGAAASFGLGSVLAYFGGLLVTGMITHVAAAAAIGRKLTLGEAWAATRGRRWQLVGLSLFGALSFLLLTLVYGAAWVAVVLLSKESVLAIVIWGVVTVPLFLSFLVWLAVRAYYLAVPALMLEQVGVLGAIRRAYALSRRQFWRTFGILLLTSIVAGIAGQIIGIPIAVVGQIAAAVVPARFTVLSLVVVQAVAQVVVLAFRTPFSSAVASLQYLDQRMRKEAYDVELMQQAGITT